MRDVEEGGAHLGLDGPQFILHLHPYLAVEGGEGFVEQEHLGLVDQGAGQSHPLGLAAADLVRHARLQPL